MHLDSNIALLSILTYGIGYLMSNAQQYFVHSPWLVFLPGACIFVTVINEFRSAGGSDPPDDAHAPALFRRARQG